MTSYPPTEAIETGIEQDNDVSSTNADWYAYADDGEHATVWEIDRLSDTLVRVQYYRCEAGLSEHVTEETFTVDPETETQQWAVECAEADPQTAVQAARDYWG